MVLFALPKLIVNPVNVRRGWNANIDKKAPEMLLSAYGMQLYFPGRVTWSTKPIHLRNPPTYRIFNPTPAQIQARITLGETAKSLRGTTGKASLPQPGRRLPAGTVLPKIAVEIQSRLKGKSYGAVYKYGYHRGPHTLEELKEMLTKAATAK